MSNLIRKYKNVIIRHYNSFEEDTQKWGQVMEITSKHFKAYKIFSKERWEELGIEGINQRVRNLINEEITNS